MKRGLSGAQPVRRRNSGRPSIRGALRFFGAMFAGFVLAAACFGIAALGFALVPVPGRQLGDTASEPPIYVCTSIAHSDVIVPAHDPLINWESLFPEVAPARLPPNVMLAIGWGDLRFFRDTPTWSDVRVSTATRALLGLGTTALRVVAVNSPQGTPGCQRLALDRAGRQALIDHVRATLILGSDGKPQRQGGGQGFEAFYLAKGRYGPLHTCNQWTAEALEAAGLPHAWFAPFSFSISWPLASVAQKT